MKKSFVLDTNVLLYDPQALFRFEDNDVVIPITVIEEIDRFKKDLNETGRNARQVSRYLDHLRAQGQLSAGVPLPNGGTLRVAMGPEATNGLPAHDPASHDHRILAIALDLKRRNGHPVVFVTKDTNLRIKADAASLRAEDYESDKVSIDEVYSGVREVVVPAEQVDAFYAAGEARMPELGLRPNEFVVLRDEANPSHTALGKHLHREGRIVPIGKRKEPVWGILPRNREQLFALELLLNDDIQLVTLIGKAGTGKTLLALAAGLQKTADEGVYQRLLVSRPIYPLGRDIGFLPGDVNEKLKPWMQPIFDNVELLTGAIEGRGKKMHRGYQELIDLGLLEIEPLTYIRGRSIPHQFLLVDEAQNLTPHEIKTIVSRAGERTKIVLTGDPYQIDNPYVDSDSNGLTYLVEKFKSEPIAGHVTLVKGERSRLAELAANLL
ncbi:MAG TPA: PhoH family protein [Thermodesulfobacteriota bacterium]|nr:PhoH family protein [Thermodesulfobacteriota bacterium]